MIPGQNTRGLPPNVQLGEIKGAWARVKGALPKGVAPETVETMRVMFYSGAYTYHSILSNAAKLPDPYPQQVIDATDKELAEFAAEQHAEAQKQADEVRRRALDAGLEANST